MDIQSSQFDNTDIENLGIGPGVLKLGSDIVPQLPVNGVKVVPLGKDQEDMIDSFDSQHPCKKMRHSSIGERTF
jgi:hypothetical protein